ncbi:MAG: thioredoxin family protein [Spirochaetales bacterium]|nr:thioredoxin family protein [Spirochaetales bacterium]
MRALDSQSFAAALATGRSVVLFHAPFSTASQNLLLLIGELSHSYPALSFYSVDFEQEKEVSIRAGVSLLPTLQAYDHGALTRQHEGLIPKDYVERWLLLASAGQDI